MQASAREIVKVVVVSVVVMLTLPAAYRVWLAYHPQAQRPRQTLTQFFELSSAVNAQRLLKTPPAKWTDREKKSAPKICAWLEAHEKKVLPWEWTEEARRKDPEGYRRVWIALFGEQASELRTRLRSERGRLVALECRNWVLGVLRTERTNQLDRIRAGQAAQESVKATAASLEDAEKMLGLLEKSEEVDDESCQRTLCRLIDM